MGLEQLKVDLVDVWATKNDSGKSDGDRDVALAAWASSLEKEKAEARSDADIARIVTQIVDFHHDTPKESLWFKFFLSFPIFCERQYDKYRMSIQQQDFEVSWYEAPFGRWGITQNELSGRYRTIPDRPYTLPDDIIQYLNDLPVLIETRKGDLVASEYNQYLANQHHQYETLLKMMPEEWRKVSHPDNWKYKRAREVLRGILGTSFLTDMRIVLNLNAFEHVINQRLEPVAQLESQVTAYRMLSAVRDSHVADSTIERMMGKNGWSKWCADLEKKVGYDKLNEKA